MPDTIAAIGILRLSGPDTRRILDVVFSPAHGGPISGQAPRRMVLGDLHDRQGRIIDSALAVLFPGPQPTSTAVRTVLPVPPVLPALPALPTTRAARSAAGCVRWSAKSRYCLGFHSVIMIPSRLNDEIRMMKSITERAARLERLFAAEGRAAYFLNTNIALAAAVTEKETSV